MNQNHFKEIKTALVVLSSKSMAFDMPALRNLVTLAYPGAAVFFISTSGDAVGAEAPRKIDLAIDFTPPGARQSLWFARRLKARSKHTVGRNAGWFYRKNNFTRIHDEMLDKMSGNLPRDYLDAETYVQKKVLELAGVPDAKQGGVGPDRGKDIAAEINA